MRKISYLDHLSPYGVQLKDVGRIHSPFLKDILKIGYTQYQYALTLFLYTPEKYYHDAATMMQMVDIDESDIPEEAPKFKTEKDRLFYEKFQKKKKKFKQTKKADPNFELPNMISLLCTFHASLNYSNIFELTVGQIRDTFSQLLRAKQLNIAEMNYSVWGGKYDPSKWIERIDKENETIGG